MVPDALVNRGWRRVLAFAQNAGKRYWVRLLANAMIKAQTRARFRVLLYLILARSV